MVDTSYVTSAADPSMGAIMAAITARHHSTITLTLPQATDARPQQQFQFVPGNQPAIAQASRCLSHYKIAL